MANVNRVFGLRPIRFKGGAKWNGEMTMYAFSASNAAAAYNGDLVTFDATNRSLALTDPAHPALPCVAPVTAALTTTAFRGVIAGFVPEPEYSHTPTASLGRMYRVASTKRYVFVIDNPDVVFVGQEDANSYVSAADNIINNLVDIVYAAGNTLTGESGVLLDSTHGTADMPFKALRYAPTVDNFNFDENDAASYAKVEVIMRNHDLANGAAGA